MPLLQILKNLKTIVDELQIYRDKIDKPITITSSWRTPSEQTRLIKQWEIEQQKPEGKQNKSIGKPSQTSLHLEGLALDFVVHGVPSQTSVYDKFNKYLFGELEHNKDYTHIGLPTFSEGYLKRSGIFSDKVYKKSSVEGIELAPLKKKKIIKRIEASNWSPKPSTFDPEQNIDMHKAATPLLKAKPEHKSPGEQYQESPVVGIGDVPKMQEIADNRLFIDKSTGKATLSGRVEEIVYPDKFDGKPTGPAANILPSTIPSSNSINIDNNTPYNPPIEQLQNSPKITKAISNSVLTNEQAQLVFDIALVATESILNKSPAKNEIQPPYPPQLQPLHLLTKNSYQKLKQLPQKT